ncbi:MAG: type III-B CRISPR-associated protein Cas10/Cmr2 [Planctomycetota bacterium]|nr:type III-B CRISPR-associated protein Cas10/Cmr2 [Planctomycetota bacterium]
MSNRQRLQFSIGPVQGFVSQSRRTRDLWSSSFLLSYLAAVAIKAVKAHDGTLILPHQDSLLEQSGHDFGTVPNRFVADFADAATATFAAKSADLAVRDCWQRIAKIVWEQFVSDIAQRGNADKRAGTKGIWDRQVAAFWEISWVVGTVEGSSQSLAARKSWRTTPATVEPGDHCTMMSDRQELSGWIRSVSRDQREKQDEFWTAFRDQKHVGTLDHEG